MSNKTFQHHSKRGLFFLIPMIVAGVAAGWLGVTVYKELHWKQFAEVKAGSIYRSGQLKPHQLASAIDSLKLRTLVCLNPAAADEERRLCEQRGVRFLSYDMHSSGSGNPDDYATIVETMADPASQPILVHCQAGVARTGAAVALYRMTYEGWSFDDAISELRTFERRGRCEPELQSMISEIYQEKLKPIALRAAQDVPLR